MNPSDTLSLLVLLYLMIKDLGLLYTIHFNENKSLQIDFTDQFHGVNMFE